MNKHIRLIPALALGMAVLSIPTLATAATTINVVDQGALIAKGAGAIVSVEVTCDLAPNSSVHVSVDLNQRAGNRLTFGNGSTINRIPITCDNTPQIVDVIVINFGGRAFKHGPAIVRAIEDVCTPDFSQCEVAAVTEEIQLVRQ